MIRPREPAEKRWPNVRKLIERGGFDEDFVKAALEQPPMQERPELDDLFD